LKSLPSSTAYATWLALVRILTGVMWLAHGIPKFTKSDSFMPPAGFITTYVTRGLQTTTGPYHDFLANVVQPNLQLFAELVRLGEVLVGIALVLGVLTRLGGLGGMLLTADYVAARGEIFSPAALQSADFSLFVLSAISLVLPTGRIAGVDAFFTRPKRAPAVVRAEFVPEPPLEGPSAPPEP
jgi:thiosulfate dehydrogenase [quinone] large subunit